MISLRTGRRAALLLTSVTATITLIGGVAWAYWTAQATNVPTYSYADTVGSGNQPTGTVTGTSVTLSWPATTTIAGQPVTGYLVQRYPSTTGGAATPAAQGTCSANPVTTLSCTETGLPAGTWYYTVTPVLGSWRGNESPRSNGQVVATDTFTLSWPSGATTLIAGNSSTLTITAKNQGQTDTGYTGAKTLTFSGPGAAPDGTAPTYNGGNPSVTFSNGVGTVPVTLYRAETPTLSVTSGAVTGSLSFTVNPGAASQLSLPTPATQTAGTAFTSTLSALDAYKNTATGYSGSKTLTWSGPGTAPDGTHSPNYPANPVTFASGVAANLPITLYRAESTSLTTTDGSLTGTSAAFTVLAKPTSQLGVSTPIAPTAGAAFTVTLSALDAYKNPAADYTGTKNLTWTGTGTPTNSPSGAAPSYPANPVTFSQTGTATVSITLVHAETAVLKVSDGSFSGASDSFTVNPGSAARLAWTHVTLSAGTLNPSPPCLFTCTASAVGNNQTFTANVSVTDTYGNTVTNLGTGHTVTVSTNGGSFTAPTSGTSVTLTIASSGAANSTQQFTVKTQTGTWTSDTLTTATQSGTTYTSATATVNRN